MECHMTNQEALSIVRQSENPNVLLMLSGGKDSSACLHMFVQAGIQVTAIHFKHKWGSTISTGEAQRRCREWSVEFLEIDISERFLDTIKGYRGGRPCLLCKPVMYEYVINELETGNYGWICIGDNADDKTTIMRIDDYTQDRPLENEYISRYFGSERGVVLPDKVRVVRPIIEWPVEDIWGQTLFSVLAIVSTILAARFRSWARLGSRAGIAFPNAGRQRSATSCCGSTKSRWAPNNSRPPISSSAAASMRRATPSTTALRSDCNTCDNRFNPRSGTSAWLRSSRSNG
jgi:hypothetical protein